MDYHFAQDRLGKFHIPPEGQLKVSQGILWFTLAGEDIIITAGQTWVCQQGSEILVQAMQNSRFKILLPGVPVLPTLSRRLRYGGLLQQMVQVVASLRPHDLTIFIRFDKDNAKVGMTCGLIAPSYGHPDPRKISRQ